VIPLPIRDNIPSLRRPVAVYLLVAVNLLAWLFQLAHGVELSVLDYGAIAPWILHGVRDGVVQLPEIGAVQLHQEVPSQLTILTSMFLHGGWLHLIGNMWFLWIFGDNVEDALGPVRFLGFYLLCGLIAAGAQILGSAHAVIPMVGASGAIAGVLGAYARLYPRARVRCLWVLIIFITTIELPAWLLLAVWLGSQFLLPSGSGVAWLAHVAGFAAGFLLIPLVIPPDRGAPAYQLRTI
jgi:membrane associated rhomboid family serine protease